MTAKPTNRIVSKTSKQIVLFLLMIVILVGALLLLEQAVMIINQPEYNIKPFTNIVLIIFSTFVFSLTSATLLYLKPRIHWCKGNAVFLGIVATVLLYTTLNVIFTPKIQHIVVEIDGATYPATISVSSLQKIKSLIILVANIVLILIVVYFIPSNFDLKKVISFVFFLFIAFAYIALVYSLIFETELYIKILNNDSSQSHLVNSFLGNRNPYSSFLLTAIIASFYFYNTASKKRAKAISLILIVPLFIGIHFTFSKTNILLSYIFIMFALIQHYAAVFKHSKALFIFESGVIVLIIVFAFVFIFTPLFDSITSLLSIKQFIINKLFFNIQGTLENRERYWLYAISILKSDTRVLLFGNGPYLARMIYERVVNGYIQTEVGFFADYHNGFIEVVSTFGIVGLVLYLALIVAMIVITIKQFKKDKKLSYFVLINIFIFIARAQIESFSALLFKSEGILNSLVFVLPYLLLVNKKDKSNEVVAKPSVTF